ncbi:MAG: YigZ family protein [Acidobacteriota bacterium]
MPTIRTVGASLRWEIDKIKGSRFLADVLPVASRESVAERLESVRDELRGASHHCYAWRLGSDPEAMRYSDDGEPSGTAGRPILAEIDGREITDVLVVVTRWFGGTKLGTGGLLRAYGAAAASALDRATILEREITDTLHLRFGYGLTGPVQGVLSAHALEPVASAYGADVHLELAVPVERIDALRRDLVDATQGSARFEE